uniref:Transcription factor castor n=1 Tax=Lygus hesperus TaxID=30085 RepID=A0A146LMX2_LYGHE
MVNMAETESMFLSAGRLPVNGVDPMSDDSDMEAAPMLAAPFPGCKRNKRKNFQPRNISYAEEGNWKSGEDEEYALDLSGAEPAHSPDPKRPKTAPSSGDEMSSAPMDLSSKPGRRDPMSLGSDSEISNSDSEFSGRSGGSRQYLFQQAFLNHQPGPEASDLKEYARNTVKELLEIYGLNSAEVAESITNNVPIANFSSGKILDSLKRGPATGAGGRNSPGGSQPPTPPRSPHSPSHPRESPKTSLSQSLAPSSSSSMTSPSSSFPPRLVLPGNMAQILALAALQDRQGSPGQPSTPTIPSTSTPKDLVQSPSLLGREQPSPIIRDGKTISPMDYSRYVRRFSSSLECGNQYCKELNYREHFHCLDCNSRVFVKKEEMIRHFKWHKKRDESLQHGFMRYSPSDDCSDRYPNCGHNRKQTHYHCIQGTCDKVYISTSDVQMHANYHRKDSAIIQEGFQRLRATEECRTPYCAFFGQRTTHFHCRRDHCQYTFKNKADMEKHKTYHIKDEQLARDGFKKFLKPDPCGFPNCRFSQVCNHIHCVRDGCSYVLHSSGQLLSHKRKHERKDSEIAYRKFKLAQQAVVNIGSNPEQSHPDLAAGSSLLLQPSSLAALNALSENLHSTPPAHDRSSPNAASTPSYSTFMSGNHGYMDHSTSSSLADYSDEDFVKFISYYGPSHTCLPNCPFANSEHYHCKEPSCEIPFRCKETAEGHARMHEAQERVSDFYQESGSLCQPNCPKEKHYHCTWDGCCEVVMPSERLEHFRSHEISAQHNNSLESLFRRKRGRPPKNRVIEVWNDYASGGNTDSPQAIFTSFKLPKPSAIGVPQASEAPSLSCSPLTITPVSSDPAKNSPSQVAKIQGFQSYTGPCPDPLCNLSVKPLHYHCSRPRCFFATDSDDFLVAHSRDFHDNIDILEGFLFFDRSVDCRTESCPSNKLNRHFHCIKPGCGYSFVRYSHMAVHKAEHENDSNTTGSMLHSPDPQPTDLSESPEKVSMKPEPHMAPEQPSFSEETTCRPTETPIKSEPPSASNESQVPEWMSLEKHDRYGPEAFSELDRLKPHIAKHSPAAMPPIMVKSENNNNEDNNQPHLNPMSMLSVGMESPETNIMQPPHFPGFSAAVAAAVANQQLAMMTSQGISFMPHAMPGLYTSPSGIMFTGPPGFGPHHSALVNNGLLESARASMLCSDATPESILARNSMSPQRERDMSAEAKKARVQSSMRMLKDEPVPEGYLRYRFNEDCRYTHCGYREHQTHFHCMRQDCGYSFCDKTRFVQHTARHERLDTLMGGDFQQYRANVSCGRPDCSYTSTLGSVQNKASHFHCIKCEFVCTDTNKVVAHRRQHQKLDSIMAAGFEKFTPSQPCSAPDTCVHNGKQTHYHCLSCQYAVLGLSQMTAHKYRHME